jgi:DinB superfamily
MTLDDAAREARIARYQEGPALLSATLAKVPEPARKWRPGPGKWSVHEVVCHCADSETNAYSRIRFLAAEESPTIQGYDQDRWAQVLDYHALPLEPALATVAAVRASTAALLRRLPASAWAREGTHSQSGRYTAETWLDVYAEHLEKHSRQIERNLAAWESAGRPEA